MLSRESPRTTRGLLTGILLASGIFWVPLGAVILGAVFAR